MWHHIRAQADTTRGGRRRACVGRPSSDRQTDRAPSSSDRRTDASVRVETLCLSELGQTRKSYVFQLGQAHEDACPKWDILPVRARTDSRIALFPARTDATGRLPEVGHSACPSSDSQTDRAPASSDRRTKASARNGAYCLSELGQTIKVRTSQLGQTHQGVCLEWGTLPVRPRTAT